MKSGVKQSRAELGLFFEPEVEGDKFFRNFGGLLTAYTTLYPRR
jgi:hypothetical protein